MARFKRDKTDTNNENTPISLSQVSQIPLKNRDIWISTQRTFNLIKKIACEPNKFKAIDTIIEETPDGKQAYNNFVRLANQGISIELYNRNTNRRIKKYDKEVRSFCASMGFNNASGLDGLIDQLHGLSIAHGGMACEVVVNSDGTDVEDVLIVDPATFQEFKWNEDKHRYEIYQERDDSKKIDLYDGNFFFVPHEPTSDHPEGTLHFLPAIPTMTQWYQLWSDSATIQNRVAYPRYLVKIMREALLNSMPMSMKNSVEAQNKAFKAAFDEVTSNLRSIGKDSDIVTFDSNDIEIIGGGVNGSGIDVRAWFEVLEPLVVNSFGMTPVLMGRLKGGSYSLGTVEFKIVTDTVDSMRRGSKRIIEQIVNLWARVKGYPVYAVVTHNPINWEVMKEKIEVELMQMQKARRSEEYGWIGHDQAAVDGIGAEKADNDDNKGLFEYLNKNFREQKTEEVIDVEEDKNPQESEEETQKEVKK